MPLGIPLPRADFIVWAIAASILVHATLLALQFRAFDPTRLKDRMPPLEVALVNSKSKDKPVVADVLAQANLDGGGNTDLPRRAKTPVACRAQGEPDGRDRRRLAAARRARAGGARADDAHQRCSDHGAGNAQAGRRRLRSPSPCLRRRR
jgi:protein TonB